MNPSSGLDLTTVLIADDHPLIGRGLVETLVSEQSLRVVGEAADGASALEQIILLKPQVAILDIDMPRLSGFEVTRRLNDLKLSVAIIMLTLHSGSDLFFAALDLGVRGYILKSSAVEDVVEGVLRVAYGGSFLSAGVQQMLNRRAVNAPHRSAGSAGLTEVESSIVRGVASGLTSRELAETLELSPRTVEYYRTAICAKLGLSGPNALLRYALMTPSRKALSGRRCGVRSMSYPADARPASRPMVHETTKAMASASVSRTVLVVAVMRSREEAPPSVLLERVYTGTQTQDHTHPQTPPLQACGLIDSLNLDVPSCTRVPGL